MGKVIGFVGSPLSGKTTQAALLYCELKTRGLPVEYVSEQARIFIARRKYDLAVDSVILSDEDQIEIMAEQFYFEDVMNTTVGNDGFVVVDGSVLNTLLYIQDEKLLNKAIQVAKNSFANFNDFYFKLFLCGPVVDPMHIPQDPNRIHTFNESLGIYSRIKPTLEKVMDISVLKELPSDWSRNKIVLEAIGLI